MRHALELVASDNTAFRVPGAQDGAAIWELVRACKPLDENSMYCNLIQCDHFRETCVVAEVDGQIAGWISAYRVPHDPDTLFVWQVAVGEEARGKGLGVRMLRHLVERPACKGVTRIQTTITEDNDASWGLFRKFSDRYGEGLEHQAHYTRSLHFRERHSTEHMVTIPLRNGLRKAA